MDDSTLNCFEKITLSAWVYPTSAPGSGWGRIIHKSDGITWDDYSLTMVKGSNRLYFRLNTDVGEETITSLNAIPFGEWSYVTGTYDGTTSKFYVNGNLASSDPSVSSINGYDVNELWVGANSNGGQFTAGMVDDVMIYNKSLSAAEVSALASA